MRIGVDLGGTKIEAIALDGDDRVVAVRRVATPREDYAATVRAIAEMARSLEREATEPCSVGIGTPGAERLSDGRMKNCNSVWLNGQPLRADLEASLDRPLRLANDADCFVLSEAADGAGAGVSIVFGVILGTGVGGGLAIDGRLVQGPARLTGEWGHTPLPYFRDRGDESALADRTCYCGRRNCIETFLSGPGFARTAAELAGGDADAATVFARADAFEPRAVAAAVLYEDQLARGLAQLVNIVDPEVIVLGGGMSMTGRLYQNVPAVLAQYVFGGEVAGRMARARHGAASGVRGAARLWAAAGA